MDTLTIPCINFFSHNW